MKTPFMSTSMVVLITLQAVGCLMTAGLMLLFWQTSLEKMPGEFPYMLIQPEGRYLFLALGTLALAVWLAFKITHLVMLLVRSPGFLRVFQIGCIVSVVCATACVVCFLAYYGSDQSYRVARIIYAIPVGYFVPVVCARRLVRTYYYSEGVRDWMGNTDYIDKSLMVPDPGETRG